MGMLFRRMVTLILLAQFFCHHITYEASILVIIIRFRQPAQDQLSQSQKFLQIATSTVDSKDWGLTGLQQYRTPWWTKYSMILEARSEQIFKEASQCGHFSDFIVFRHSGARIMRGCFLRLLSFWLGTELPPYCALPVSVVALLGKKAVCSLP